MTTPTRSRPGVWIGLFLASTGVIAALRLTDAIDGATAFVLFAAASGLLIQYGRSLSHRRGVGRAITRYNKGIAVTSVLYVLGLGLAIFLDQRMELPPAVAFIVALLPVIPLLGMIWVMGRYLAEEQDEYLRYKATLGSLGGLGLVLAAGSFWGFLETFALVPHVPAWWVVPVWAIGLGLTQAWLSLRDRAGGEE